MATLTWIVLHALFVGLFIQLQMFTMTALLLDDLVRTNQNPLSCRLTTHLRCVINMVPGKMRFTIYLRLMTTNYPALYKISQKPPHRVPHMHTFF